ncbi:HD domain-containing protein [Edaphovirga cremea]|uniref:HD domain-containing protein n=1 Tax=Edaphovirga cremea TaxID=2267246 RepID=UPI000DEFB2F8|nr:ATP-binding protein [Edaphovirga cremea]
MALQFEETTLWEKTFRVENDDVTRLKIVYSKFRENIDYLLKNIGAELPGLTVHDITHLDALWDIADQIIGEHEYLNPIEGFILGSAFLLHDAAHVSAAYDGGFESLKQTDEWKDLIALKFNNKEPVLGTQEYTNALFDIVRGNHAAQAKKLANASWRNKSSMTQFFLIEDSEIREYYSDVIGEVSESHHWSSEKVYKTFNGVKLNSPGFFKKSNWTVEPLKIAYILRTADAAHIDSRRAPSFLFATTNPAGISHFHWSFQNKLGRPALDESNKLRITSGASFGEDEREAWWLAYNTATMIDNEITLANNYLKEADLRPLQATGVLGVNSPLEFSKFVKVKNWLPDDISIHVGNLPKLIKNLGGKALYGENNIVSLREIIQNSFDAIKAAQKLGYLNKDEGIIKVSLKKENEENWVISIIDNGIGMSKYVLTEVLLDFGRSLWTTDDIRYEYPKLAQTGFSSIGQFGIGFYSIFMITNNVEVITNRYKPTKTQTNTHSKLSFRNGLIGRPYLSIPSDAEQLKRHGTKINFKVTNAILNTLLNIKDNTILSDKELFSHFAFSLNYIFPSCEMDIELEFGGTKSLAVTKNSWKDISSTDLLERLGFKDTFFYSDELIPIKLAGEIVGRLNIGSLSSYGDRDPNCIVTYKGIKAGTINGVYGLCISLQNNEKADRNDAKPSYPIESWESWADELTTKYPDKSMESLLKIHPLIPFKDLKVWYIGDERVYLSEVLDFAKEKNALMTIMRGVEYDIEDDVPQSTFDDEFEIEDNLITISKTRDLHPYFLGRKDTDFIKNITDKTLDYELLFERGITKIWGGFNTYTTLEIVGYVDGKEIKRDVLTYEKI